MDNQPPDRGDLDLWSRDHVLRGHAVAADFAGLGRFGALLGSSHVRALARDAQRRKPQLDACDPERRRGDTINFDSSYHELMTLGLGSGYAAVPWSGDAAGHQTHAAMVYLLSQVEPGVCCPMTMTYAAYPALAAARALAHEWQPRLAAGAYDPARVPVAQKTAATMGMAMTEIQGGSDVRANRTRAEPADGHYVLHGAKWFCSAPMSDGFLTLAQAPGGLTCFLVPRWLETGANAIRLLRLKDKLGNTANASAEIEYRGARAFAVGGQGDGVRTIITMVHHTRLDTAMAPAGLMRAALDEAFHWVTHRTAFQKRLIDLPLMRRVLADLVLDWEGATALGFHVAAAFDNPDRTPFARVAVALAKFLNNKRCPQLVYEAMEVLGGNGYIEDSPMPMLFRESPLNSIWEGSGNVICLDILRTLARDPDAKDMLDADLDAACGQSRAYNSALAAWRDDWPGAVDEADARAFAERLATLLTASVLLRKSPSEVSEAYCACRLAPQRTRIAGASALANTSAILDRLAPE